MSGGRGAAQVRALRVPYLLPASIYREFSEVMKGWYLLDNVEVGISNSWKREPVLANLGLLGVPTHSGRQISGKLSSLA